MKKERKNKLLQAILWVIEGIAVGIGAILPGVSGGTLCYAFGVYTPLLEVLSNPIKNLKKHWLMLLFFVIGGGIGFIGFAGVTNWLLVRYESAVLAAFVGLILGTLPSLWREAGEKGRNKFSFVALAVSFLLISAVFFVFKNIWQITIPPTFFGYLACGVIWGLSFIVPGFSSSTLLLFFGIYEKMSEGISRLSLSVVVPIGISMLICLLLLSRVMKLVFDRFHSIASHSVIGFVLATTLMLLPPVELSLGGVSSFVACIVGGAAAGYFFTRLCDKIRSSADTRDEK
jgi:putative membrane protein